jgi:hypothetical protein
MDGIIRSVLASLAAVVAVTGLALGGPTVVGAGEENRADQVALKRDEDDVEASLAREDEDEDWDDDDFAVLAANNGDVSRSFDRSRDMTTSDKSRSRDRSRDRTGDGVGVNDRSWSKDRSRDRTGDHNSADYSRSRSASGDNTSASRNSNSRAVAA